MRSARMASHQALSIGAVSARSNEKPKQPDAVLKQAPAMLIHEGYRRFEKLPKDIKNWTTANFLLPTRGVPVASAVGSVQTVYYVKSARNTYSCWTPNTALPKVLPESLPSPVSKDFLFVGFTDSALAFLHDHRDENDQFPGIILFYTETTESFIWRKLFNVLIHKRPDVLKVRVVVDSAFWEKAPWTRELAKMLRVNWADGPDMIFGWRGWNKNDYHEHNFLSHLARFPLKRGDKDVSVILEILKSDETPERRAYLDALRVSIDTRRASRKDIAVAKYGVCSPDLEGVGRVGMTKQAIALRAVCSSKHLSSSCYWGTMRDDYSDNED